MNILFVGRQHGRSKALELNALSIFLLSLVFVVFVSLCIAVGYRLGGDTVRASLATDEKNSLNEWEQTIRDQQAEIKTVRIQAQEKLDALTREMGKMQARLLRLDALGVRLTEAADLDDGEFDFTREPPLGGPSTGALGSLSASDIGSQLDNLDLKLRDRQKQFDVLFNVLGGKRIEKELFIAGRPVKKGWMSSPFGYRSDPFTGKRAWHAGVDFAGKEGGDIIAVASGVVTFAGERYGYGNMIEINHGNGYATRYAHCKQLNAQVGDIVSKGQVIALLGSTGRSTGPHVHLEILRHSKPVDPEKFVWRPNKS